MTKEKNVVERHHVVGNLAFEFSYAGERNAQASNNVLMTSLTMILLTVIIQILVFNESAPLFCKDTNIRIDQKWCNKH